MLAAGISSVVSSPFLKRADWSVITSSNLAPKYFTGHFFSLPAWQDGAHRASIFTARGPTPNAAMTKVVRTRTLRMSHLPRTNIETTPFVFRFLLLPFGGYEGRFGAVVTGGLAFGKVFKDFSVAARVFSVFFIRFS